MARACSQPGLASVTESVSLAAPCRVCIFVQNQVFSQQTAHTINVLYESSVHAVSIFQNLTSGMAGISTTLDKVRQLWCTHAWPYHRRGKCQQA